MDRATHNVQDASLRKTRALPAAASSTVHSAGIDLGALSARGARLADCELVVEAPAVGVAVLPNTKTLTYTVQHDDDSAFGGAANLFPSLIVQTGAGGAGAAAAVARRKLPTDCKRYVRLSITSGADVGDGSALSAVMSLRF